MTTTNDTSPPDLDAIEARANEASAGPWAVDPCQGAVAVIAGGPVSLIVPWRSDKGALADCAFIAYGRTDVPALVARVRELAAANEQLRSAARGVIDGFLAMQDDIRAEADEAARVANAERLRDAFRALVEEVSK